MTKSEIEPLGSLQTVLKISLAASEREVLEEHRPLPGDARDCVNSVNEGPYSFFIDWRTYRDKFYSA
jgi:hypothetical protein